MVENRARYASSFGDGRAQDLDALALTVHLDLEPGARLRREAADAVMHVAREQPPIDPRLLGIELGRIGRALVMLRAAGETPLLELCERLHHQVSTDAREPVMEFPSRLFGADRHACLEADRTRVEAFVN